MSLRLASFGMRGFIGQSLSIKAAMDFAAAFGTYLKGGRILLGRDTRYSSPMLHSAVASSLIGCGCEVVDLGVCPTPMIQFSVKPLGAAGGVSISGGHHGMGWNSISLMDAEGAFLEPAGGENVLDIYHAGDFIRQTSSGIGRLVENKSFSKNYFDALVSTVNADAIRKAGFNILIDPLGGAGCPFLAEFSSRLGFRLIAVNDQPSGYLPREAEPRPRSALQMASFIKHVHGHAGFVFSSDMYRMSMVTEEGEPVSEESTFAVMADYILGKKQGTLVTNCCSSRAVDEIAARHGCRVIKTPVGPAYIMAALQDESGVIGGEGSGSVFLPSFSRAADGFLMMAVVLEAMAASGLSLSRLIQKTPRYHIVKRTLSCGSRAGYGAIDAIKRRGADFPGSISMDLTDGVRFDWASGWVHARSSNTEQMVRVISEDRDRALAVQRADHMMRLIGALI